MLKFVVTLRRICAWVVGVCLGLGLVLVFPTPGFTNPLPPDGHNPSKVKWISSSVSRPDDLLKFDIPKPSSRDGAVAKFWNLEKLGSTVFDFPDEFNESTAHPFDNGEPEKNQVLIWAPHDYIIIVKYITVNDPMKNKLQPIKTDHGWNFDLNRVYIESIRLVARGGRPGSSGPVVDPVVDPVDFAVWEGPSSSGSVWGPVEPIGTFLEFRESGRGEDAPVSSLRLSGVGGSKLKVPEMPGKDLILMHTTALGTARVEYVVGAPDGSIDPVPLVAELSFNHPWAPLPGTRIKSVVNVFDREQDNYHSGDFDHTNDVNLVARVGEEVDFKLEANTSRGGGETIYRVLDGVKAPGLTYGEDGRITGKVAGAPWSSYTVTVGMAKPGNFRSAGSNHVTVSIRPAGEKLPTFDSDGLIVIPAGVALGEAEDEFLDFYPGIHASNARNYRVNMLPKGISLNPFTGRFEGTAAWEAAKACEEFGPMKVMATITDKNNPEQEISRELQIQVVYNYQHGTQVHFPDTYTPGTYTPDTYTPDVYTPGISPHFSGVTHVTVPAIVPVDTPGMWIPRTVWATAGNTLNYHLASGSLTPHTETNPMVSGSTQKPIQVNPQGLLEGSVNYTREELPETFDTIRYQLPTAHREFTVLGNGTNGQWATQHFMIDAVPHYTNGSICFTHEDHECATTEWLEGNTNHEERWHLNYKYTGKPMATQTTPETNPTLGSSRPEFRLYNIDNTPCHSRPQAIGYDNFGNIGHQPTPTETPGIYTLIATITTPEGTDIQPLTINLE